jgi:hypothetical protein
MTITTITATTATMSLTVLSLIMKAFKVRCASLRSVSSPLTLEVTFFRKAASHGIKGRLAYNRMLFEAPRRRRAVRTNDPTKNQKE